MAIKHEMIIEIAADGTVKIKTHGIKGAQCEDELRPIEAALGKTTRREKTAEFYETAVSQNKARTGTK